MKVLLSIKPEFVREIFQGRKKFEYRKNVFTKHVTQVVVYSTKPEGMIVGEFSVKKILSDTPEKLWEKHPSFPVSLKSSLTNILKDVTKVMHYR